MDSASEQPARRSGIRTVLAGIQDLRRLGHEVDAGHDDDVGLGLHRHAGEGERVAAQVRDAVEDVGRHVVVREHDGVALDLERLDFRDQRRDGGDFDVGQDARQVSHGLTPFMLGVSILDQ